MQNCENGKNEKKQVKRIINQISRGNIIYVLINMAVAFIYMFFEIIHIFIIEPNENKHELMLQEIVDSSGTYMIWAVVVGWVFLTEYFSRRKIKCLKSSTGKKMTKSTFVQILCVFMGVQLIGSLIAMGTEALMNIFGYTVMSQIEMASGFSTTFSMFLYASFVGPVIEEIIYRGYVMNGLKQHGKVFAIVISSILFGIMHANFAQNMFAFMVGIVLAYTAMEYGLKWSIVLHIINNCIFGDILGRLVSVLPELWQYIVMYGIEGAFLLAGIVVLWKKRKNVKRYIDSNRTKKKYYLYTLTSIWFIVFVVAHFLLSFVGIEKIS